VARPTIAELSKSLDVKCCFQIEVMANDDWSKTTVAIGCDRQPPSPAVMVVAEHLMTMVAMQGVDFEKSLALLCEGARSNRVMMANGQRTDH
jgi:hypothetical protein